MKKQEVKVKARSSYGAVELINSINKFTIRGFLMTIGIFGLFFVFYSVSGAFTDKNEKEELKAPIVIETIDINVKSDEVSVPIPPATRKVAASTQKIITDNPVVVPDIKIAPDAKEFASIDEKYGTPVEDNYGINMGDYSDNIDLEKEGINIETKVDEPPHNVFKKVEKLPSFDIAELQNMVEYPKLAKEAGIEGRVVVKALIDKDGSVRKTMILDSDNSLLNQAAIDAIKNYNKFEPGIQHDRPVMVWIAIPIKFKLR